MGEEGGDEGKERGRKGERKGEWLFNPGLTLVHHDVLCAIKSYRIVFCVAIFVCCCQKLHTVDVLKQEPSRH